MFARDHLALSTNSQNLNNEVSQMKIFYKLWIIWSGLGVVLGQVTPD